MSSISILLILSLPVIIFLGVRWTYLIREKEREQLSSESVDEVIEDAVDDDHSDAA